MITTRKTRWQSRVASLLTFCLLATCSIGCRSHDVETSTVELVAASEHDIEAETNPRGALWLLTTDGSAEEAWHEDLFGKAVGNDVVVDARRPRADVLEVSVSRKRRSGVAVLLHFRSRDGQIASVDAEATYRRHVLVRGRPSTEVLSDIRGAVSITRNEQTSESADAVCSYILEGVNQDGKQYVFKGQFPLRIEP